jgi:hypothetical protein
MGRTGGPARTRASAPPTVIVPRDSFQNGNLKAEMVPFRYVDFYDVPRCIVVRCQGRLFLLQSAFNCELDEYPDSYSVYALPELVEDSLKGSSWEFLESIPMNCIGQIRIDRVRFDPSKRKALDPSCLDDLVLKVEP